MSLRRRLLLTLGISFCVLWALAAAWLYSDLRDQVRETLDQRLAASARMVAGLVAQLPEGAWAQANGPALPIPHSSGVACQISSPAGQVLMRTHGDFADKLDAPSPGFTNRQIKGQRWRLYTYVQSGLHITTADRLADRIALQHNIIWVAVLPFVVALLGSLVVLWLGIRRGLRPFEYLRRELACRAPDALTPVEIDNAPTELAPAIDTLNQLLVRTRNALRREQRFTNDAAHELRTPLTAIKTHVQLASRVPSEQAHESMAQAEAGIARLQATLEQLLMLARLETDQNGADAMPVSSATIVTTALADLTSGARINVDDTSAPAMVDVPQELSVAALRNLLENALRHSPDDASVQLEVHAREGGIVFTLRDRGDWPAGQSTQRLTQRFWQQGGGQSDEQGSGLGLAIVAAITERFNGALSFNAREGGGLVARLTLPAYNHSGR